MCYNCTGEKARTGGQEKMKFELLVDSRLTIAETPVWDKADSTLLWTDPAGGIVHRYDPVSKTDTCFEAGGHLGSAIPCDNSRDILVISDRGAELIDPEKGTRRLVADPENGNEKNIYNDSRCDSRGRIFMSSVARTYGTDAYTPDQTGAFYMVDTNGEVTCVTDGIQQYNGMVWTSDDKKLLVVDTYHESLLCYAYDIERGPVSGPEEVISFRDAQGMPDGMSIDEEDRIYICHWTGVISVWDASFRHVEDIPFPVEQVTCCGFGGETMSDLYVAAAAYGYSGEDILAHPGAGGLFAARTQIRGRGDHLYHVRQ